MEYWSAISSFIKRGGGTLIPAITLTYPLAVSLSKGEYDLTITLGIAQGSLLLGSIAAYEFHRIRASRARIE